MPGRAIMLACAYLAAAVILGSCANNKYIPKDSDVLIRLGSVEPGALQDSFDVLVWNIRKGQEANFDKDFRGLALDKDIILIQEYLGSSDVRDVLDQAGVQYDIATSFIYLKSDARSGVATGSRSPSHSVVARITDDVEPFVKTPKAALLTQYEIDGTDQLLLVLNIHGRNRGGLEPFQRQLEQLRNSVAQHDGPVLFGGDFNTNNQEKREYLDRYMAELGLEEVEFRPDGRTRSGLTKIPLDYIFTRGLQVERAEVMTALSGSDHKAMVVALRIAQ